MKSKRTVMHELVYVCVCGRRAYVMYSHICRFDSHDVMCDSMLEIVASPFKRDSDLRLCCYYRKTTCHGTIVYSHI